MRKGQYFELDALISILILIAGLVYVRTLDVPGAVHPDITFDEGAVSQLRSQRVDDVPWPLIGVMENTTTANITDRGFSVARQIAIYATHNNLSLARNLTMTMLDPHVPQNYGYGVYLVSSKENLLIYNRSVVGENGTLANDISTSRTLVSGLVDEDTTDAFAQWPAFIEVRVWI